MHRCSPISFERIRPKGPNATGWEHFILAGQRCHVRPGTRSLQRSHNKFEDLDLVCLSSTWNCQSYWYTYLYKCIGCNVVLPWNNMVNRWTFVCVCDFVKSMLISIMPLWKWDPRPWLAEFTSRKTDWIKLAELMSHVTYSSCWSSSVDVRFLWVFQGYLENTKGSFLCALCPTVNYLVDFHTQGIRKLVEKWGSR